MSFTVVKAEGDGQVQRALPGMLVAFNQLDDQLSTESKKTEGAFQELMQQVRDNYRALAAENIQLRQRVTELESQARTSETLHVEEKRSHQEIVEELRQEMRAMKDAQKGTAAKVDHLTGDMSELRANGERRWELLKRFLPNLAVCEKIDGKCSIQ